MGRLLLLLLLIATFVLLWKAFGPASWRRSDDDAEPLIKGPDDDDEFLWRLELEQFKKRRAAEAAAEAEEERRHREQHNKDKEA